MSFIQFEYDTNLLLIIAIASVIQEYPYIENLPELLSEFVHVTYPNIKIIAESSFPTNHRNIYLFSYLIVPYFKEYVKYIVKLYYSSNMNKLFIGELNNSTNIYRTLANKHKQRKTPSGQKPIFDPFENLDPNNIKTAYKHVLNAQKKKSEVLGSISKFNEEILPKALELFKYSFSSKPPKDISLFDIYYFEFEEVFQLNRKNTLENEIIITKDSIDKMRNRRKAFNRRKKT